MKGVFKSGSFWFAFSAALLLLAGVASSVVFWGWLHPNASTTVSNSETLRNVGLLIGGVLAFVFALWRGWVAERQAVTAQCQANTAQQSLLNERYQRGAEMLGSKVVSVRLGGIHTLQRLASERPEQYHIQIMQLLCSFVRNPTESEDTPRRLNSIDMHPSLREDVQTIMKVIGSRREADIKLEQQSNYVPDLSHAHLENLSLERANLSCVNLSRANIKGAAYLIHANLSETRLTDTNLSGATLAFANLSDAILRGANLASTKIASANLSNALLDKADLSNADLNSADLSDATLYDTNLSGTDLSHEAQGPVTGLTQIQLDCAHADKNNFPKLAGVDDAKSGRPLIWRGRSLDDES